MWRFPRLAVALWFSIGVYFWGTEFLSSNMDTLTRAGVVFGDIEDMAIDATDAR